MINNKVLLVAFVALVVAVAAVDESESKTKCGGKSLCAKQVCGHAHKQCTTCSKDMRCGWCGDGEGSCMAGGAAGPHHANCSTWDFAFCSALSCSSHTSCASCAADDMCGWCSSSNICTEGNVRGPVFMTCLAKDWLAEDQKCERLLDEPCQSDNCEKNNELKNHRGISTDEEPPEDLDSVEWYDAVKPQIHVDLVPEPEMPPTVEPPPPDKVYASYPMPKSDDINEHEGDEPMSLS